MVKVVRRRKGLSAVFDTKWLLKDGTSVVNCGVCR